VLHPSEFSKSLVPSGVGVDGYIISSKSVDGTQGEVSLFFVPAETPGLQIVPYRLVDGRVAVKLDFDAIQVPASHKLDGGFQALTEVQQKADIARCAETLGLMETIFETTLE